MDIEADGLKHELEQLRRRRGVWSHDMVELFGPRMRSAFGVTDPSFSAGRLREVLREAIDVHLSDQREFRLALLAGYALHPETKDYDTFGERMKWLAEQLGFELRTARRRVAQATSMLIHNANATPRTLRAAQPRWAGSDAGYVMVALDAQVRFVGDQPMIIEERQIRAIEKLDVIWCRFGVPSPLPGVAAEDLKFDIEVTDGGRLIDSERVGNVISFHVKPWRPLEEGEEYTFTVKFRFPSGQPMASHYVVEPVTRFEAFNLAVYFDLCTPPIQVWKVDGVPHRQIDGRPIDEAGLRLGPAGRVEVSFGEIPTGTACGVAWAWG